MGSAEPSSSSSPLSRLCPEVDWQGDRGRFLLSPFRPRELNPESWADKDNFWRRTLNKFMSEKEDRVLFKTAGLCAELAPQDGSRNAALEEVLCRMQSEGNNVLSDLKRVRGEVGLGEAWWRRSARALAGVVFGGSEEATLVWRPNLDKRCSRLKEAVREARSSSTAVRAGASCVLVPVDEVLKESSFAETDAEVSELCLAKLKTDGAISLGSVDGKRWAKLLTTDSASGEAFDDCDAAAVKLSAAARGVKDGLEEREKRREEARSAAKAALARGDRASARRELARDLRLRREIERRRAALDNLESMLSAVAAAREDREVVASLSAGAAALRSSLAANAPQKAEEVVGEAADAIEEVREIADIISRANFDSSDDCGLEELEEELASLVDSESSDEKTLAEGLERLSVADNLPEPGKDEIVASEKKEEKKLVSA